MLVLWRIHPFDGLQTTEAMIRRNPVGSLDAVNGHVLANPMIRSEALIYVVTNTESADIRIR